MNASTQQRIRSRQPCRPALALAISAVLAGAAHAQQAPVVATAKSVETLEEVVVTAQKREQRAIDVPIAISTITGSDMTARGAQSLNELEFTIPGLSTFSYGPGATEFVQMRGVSSTVGRATVGKYFGEMPVNPELLGLGIDMRLIDLERIEVLRGPQPTLYGDGSMGGTIRYVPARPSLTETSGELAAEVSSLTDGDTGWLANGHVDIPLSDDRVGLRLAGGYEKQGGWIDRVPTGEKDVNSYDIGTLRATFLAKLTDSSELTLLWQHNHSKVDNKNFGTDRKTNGTLPSPDEQKYDLVSAVLSVDLGFAELVETPGYLKFTMKQQYDITPYFLPYVPYLLYLYGYDPTQYNVTSVALTGDSDYRIVTNELRLVSKAAGPWSWAAGFDYKDSKNDGISKSPTFPDPIPIELLTAAGSGSTKIWALWGEVGYAFAGDWQATLGARYFHDKTESTGSSVQFGVPSATAAEGTFTSTNPRFNLSYKISDDSMVYFNAAKGFRSGGFNITSQEFPTYDPESLWTYELGSKGLYFERKLELEAGVYYNDWKDVQTNFFTPQGLTITTNGGNVKGWGFDLGLTWRPVAGLQLGGTFGWNNMEYKEVPPNGDKFVGDPPDTAVQQSWSAFVDYRTAVSSGTSLYGRADFQHAGDAQITIRRPPYDQLTKIPPRDLLNLRLGVTFGRYDVSLYADNALDEKAPVIQAPFGVLTENVEQRPRLYGLALRAKF